MLLQYYYSVIAVLAESPSLTRPQSGQPETKTNLSIWLTGTCSPFPSTKIRMTSTTKQQFTLKFFRHSFGKTRAAIAICPNVHRFIVLFWVLPLCCLFFVCLWHQTELVPKSCCSWYNDNKGYSIYLSIPDLLFIHLGWDLSSNFVLFQNGMTKFPWIHRKQHVCPNSVQRILIQTSKDSATLL